MATKDELIKKATELGVPLTGDETVPVLGDLIKAKTEANQLIADEEAKKAAAVEEERIKREADDEAALQKESERVRLEMKAKAEETRAQRAAAVGTPDQERKYTDADVKAFLKQALAELKAGGDVDDPNNLDDDDPYKQKQVRLPRFQGKFVLGFKNTNTDEYFPELVIHAFDVWNDQLKRNEPWVTAILQDVDKEVELTVRLETLITKSQKVWVDLVERIEVDRSFSQGRVELSEVKDYSRSGTGVYKKLKVTQAEYSYKLRLPHTGKEIIVGREVINW